MGKMCNSSFQRAQQGLPSLRELWDRIDNVHLEHMPSEWEGKAKQSPWGDLKFGRPIQVKQSART